MKYKNITKKDLILIGYGIVKAGEIIETKDKINNANFKELIKEIKEKEEDKPKNKEL